MTRLLIFDDGGGGWGPMTDRRAVFELRTGAVTTLERIERVTGLPAQSLVVPRRIEPVVGARFPALGVNRALETGTWLVVNGRCSQQGLLENIRAFPRGTAFVQEDGQLIAVKLDHDQANAYLNNGIGSTPSGLSTQIVTGRTLLEHPWDILNELATTLSDDLVSSEVEVWSGARSDAVSFGDHPVRVHPDATLQPRVVFNTEQGPIVIERGVLIGAMAVLEGPCYIGHDSQVACNAHVRPNTVVGPVCKVAGEISHTIIHSHSNKGHHGYLGHSLVGQWVNLGAATNVSNLKNTYGQVHTRLEPDTPQQPTGRIYQGPIIGDFVRTAIGTRIVTGSCIGTGSMIALSTYCPKFVDRFRFMTDDVTELYDVEKLLPTIRTMMSRRDERLTDEEESLIRELHRDTNAPPSHPGTEGDLVTYGTTNFV